MVPLKPFDFYAKQFFDVINRQQEIYFSSKLLGKSYISCDYVRHFEISLKKKHDCYICIVLIYTYRYTTPKGYIKQSI